MTFSTDARVASRTFAAPLMTRETVPTPTPDAAATSRDRRPTLKPTFPLPRNVPARWNRFH